MKLWQKVEAYQRTDFKVLTTLPATIKLYPEGKYFIKFNRPSHSTADLGRIILIGVLSTLGIIVLLLILLAAAYFWWRHKRSQLEFVEPTDENETSSGSLKFQQLLETQQQEQLLLEQQKQQQQQQQAGKEPNNINRKLNGFLNLKTPLIGWVNLACACKYFSFI